MSLKIDDFIKKYKAQTKICSEIDYADKKSVKRNNQAADVLFTMKNQLAQLDKESIQKFILLLDDKEFRTDRWAAIHLLEMPIIEKQVEKKALKIIKSAIEEDSLHSIGYEYWLKEYEKNKKSGSRK